MRASLSAARRSKTLATVGVGLVLGLAIGYVFMSSVENVLRERAASNQVNRYSQPGIGRKELGRTDLRETLLEPQEVIAEKATEIHPHIATDDAQDTYHTMMTSNGSPYLNIQTRIMYQTYKMVQRMPGGDKMVGFTRIMHRTKPDILMKEVPTFRAEPLDPKCDNWCEFPVADRANAVKQFFQAAEKTPSLIKAKWILMLEGDYVWMKPLPPIPRADSGQPGWAFPYGYINAQYPDLHKIMREMYPEDRGPLKDIPNTGPAPVLMRVPDWRKCLDDWERLAEHIEKHEEPRKRLGWVREMYGFSIATALQKVKLELKHPPDSPLMTQPPQDIVQGHSALFHYTWNSLVEKIIDSKPKKVWVFDKREYTAVQQALKVPRFPLPPPWEEGLQLHDGKPWSKELYNITTAMLTQMNRAIADLPDLTGSSIH